jgi:RNA recognition motif-containing protein
MTVSSAAENNDQEESIDDSLKIFVSRIPSKINEATIRGLIEEHFGEGSVKDVQLVYNHTDKQPDDDDNDNYNDNHDTTNHRGFGFVIMANPQAHSRALQKGSLRVHLSNKRKRTMYLRPVVREDPSSIENNEQDHVLNPQDTNPNPMDQKNICFLWTQNTCPYGTDCKFEHTGPGGCRILSPTDPTTTTNKKRGKCFSFKKTGKCKLGDACPFRHVLGVPSDSSHPVRQSKRRRESLDETGTQKRKRDKVPQPLSVRVFGLNYNTTEADVREFFEPCGKIREISYPVFEDSGRSKGYCGVWFTSPKAVQKACEELDGKELQGRWLRVQAGKMLIQQWETMEKDRKETKKEIK